MLKIIRRALRGAIHLQLSHQKVTKILNQDDDL